MKLTLVAFVVSLLAVNAQFPKPCATPQAWHGRASSYDHGKGVHNRFNITYDFANRRKRIVDEIDANTPGRSFHELLMLYNEDIFYEIDLATGYCEARKPFFPWQPYEIPDNATFEGEYTLGQSLRVQVWSDRVVAPIPIRETWIGTFTVGDCIPVYEVISKGEISTSITSTFYNVVGGFDANVFIPPSQCKSAVIREN
ncbi:mammalian ependymin-related protein 1-like [Corticium candelabrum]|uniref:mammalian ependymin-related protein 1-like n=1 Tax=Corticium candelabrum TaxID=121492 RepID=UPI002E26F6E0|nr:mammalian ependymin-related protein 1-like [Corticium candelabrum]